MRKLILSGLAGLLVAVIWPASAIAGFAPDRPTLQCATKWQCPGSNYVTFNSFTDNPNYGDERDFFRAKDASDSNPSGHSDSVVVRDGQKIQMQVLVHNDANPTEMGVEAAKARNTRLQVVLPGSASDGNAATAYISADNASPVTISDTASMSGTGPATLTFADSSVSVTKRANNGDGDFFTQSLGGVSFAGNGFSVNLGDWQGGFKHHAKIAFTAVVHTATTPVVAPAAQFSCSNLQVSDQENGSAVVTASSNSLNANVRGYTFTTKDSSGNVVNSQVINTTSDKAVYNFKQSKAGTYTVSTVVHTDKGDTVASTCTKEVTVNEPVVLSAASTETVEEEDESGKGNDTALPDTGASALAVFTGVSTLAGAGHFIFRRYLG